MYGEDDIMPPHRKSQKKKSTDFSLYSKLQLLESRKLYNLVQNLIEKKPENYRLVLEWFKKKEKYLKDADTKKEKAFINDELLMEYWENARSIISEFNEYGGGHEDEEEEAYGWIDKISELIKEENLSADAKFRFLDDAFKEYNIGNSGFEDGLMDVFFDTCKSKEEWRHLVKKLEEKPSEWRRDLIMKIQKEHLHDDDAYLKIRMKDLKYGADYYDLALFYIKKKDTQKAIEIAEDGLIKGEGRISELLKFLSDHYSKSRDTANLERIAQYALKEKSDEKVMQDRLFNYYNTQNDYENAKKSLLKAFEYVKAAGYIAEVRSYAHYNKMKQFLSEKDWKNIEPKIIREIREKDLEDYLRICLDKNMKKEVMHILLNSPKKQSRIGFMYEPEYDFDEFANQLKKDFPEEIIKYYWQKAYRNISGGNRNTYHTAANYLTKVKDLYINQLKEENKWNQRFASLKAEFRKRPAFLEEVSKL